MKLRYRNTSIKRSGCY